MNELKGIPVVGKKLRVLRDVELFFSQEELAPLISMSKNNLSRIEGEELAGMNRRSFRKLAELRKVSVEELRRMIGPDGFSGLGLIPVADIHGRGVNGKPKTADSIDTSSAHHVDQVVTFDMPVSAGKLSLCDVQQACEEVGDAGCFRVRVAGDSMDDGTRESYWEKIWIVCSRPRALAEGLTYGKDYVLWTADESIFKRVLPSEDRHQYLLLRSLNPDKNLYPDQFMHRREVMGLALVVRREW